MSRPSKLTDQFGHDVSYAKRNALAWILVTGQLPTGCTLPGITLQYNFDVGAMRFRLIPEAVLLAKSSRLYTAVVYLRRMGFQVRKEQFRGTRTVRMIREDGTQAFATNCGYVYMTDASGNYRKGNNGVQFTNSWCHKDDGERFPGSPKVSS